FRAALDDQRRLTTSFVRAVEAGDLQGLMDLLTEDITLWTDGGGKVTAALRPIHGRDAVARFIVAISRRVPPTGFELVEINGDPAVVMRFAAQPPLPNLAVAVLELDEGRVHAIRVVGNPDKLAHILDRFPSLAGTGEPE